MTVPVTPSSIFEPLFSRVFLDWITGSACIYSACMYYIYRKCRNWWAGSVVNSSGIATILLCLANFILLTNISLSRVSV